MKQPVILIGVGEIGGVFARGFLKTGYPVYPVARSTNILELAKTLPNPQAVIVAVGEKDLNQTLDTVPVAWEPNLVLLQNELLPADWLKHKISNPTVISVWFEKKPGKDFKVIIPSQVYGPKAAVVKEALESLGIACRIPASEDELLFELVLKNLYILTTNITGLKVGGTVGELWSKNEDLARAVANDVLDIQFYLAKKTFDREKLIQEMVKAFNGDPDHQCMGRSAPGRLERAIKIADEAALHILTLKYVADSKV